MTQQDLIDNVLNSFSSYRAKCTAGAKVETVCITIHCQNKLFISNFWQMKDGEWQKIGRERSQEGLEVGIVPELDLLAQSLEILNNLPPESKLLAEAVTAATQLAIARLRITRQIQIKNRSTVQ